MVNLETKILFLSENTGFQDAVMELSLEEPDLNLILGDDSCQVRYLIENEGFDLIVLDELSSSKGSQKKIELIRKNTSVLPIIFLVGIDNEILLSEIEIVSQINILTKPLRIEELFRKIRELSRSYGFGLKSAIRFKEFILEPEINLLTKPTGISIKLTDKETKILRYLYKSKGKVISKRWLLDNVWGYKAELSTHTLETHIYRLRKKIETIPGKPNLILSEVGGYYLNI